MLKQSRINKVEPHFGLLEPGQKFILGIENLENGSKRLSEVGFSEELDEGERVLPPSSLGSNCEYNAEGKYIKHKDQPKETAYSTVEWTWEEWNGPHDTVERSKFVDREYERYPRTFKKPPSIELTIARKQDKKLVITPVLEFKNESFEEIKHITNLLLEIFGECQIFTEELELLIPNTVNRLNWEVLPEGKLPWKRIQEEVDPLIEEKGERKRPVIKNRFKVISEYEPDFAAIGKSGFSGYIIFGFKNEKIFVLESIHYGNATYVFGKRWKELSKMTKAEILSRSLQKYRVIHTQKWENEMRGVLEGELN